MLPSDKKAVGALLLYAVAQFLVPIALSRGTPAIRDALWIAGTIAPAAMGIAILAWYFLGRSMRRMTAVAIWIALGVLAALNHFIIAALDASC
jgi:hypothetical protein